MRSAAHLTRGGWRYLTLVPSVIAAQVSLGGRGSTLRDPSACSLGTKTRFANHKKLGAAALAADWPIELRFHSKTVALAALQYRTN